MAPDVVSKIRVVSEASMASVVKIVSPLTKDQQMDRSNVIANGPSVVEGNILKGSSVTVKSELEFNYLSTSIKKD